MISNKEKCIPILVEEGAFEGVRKIAEKSANDMELILGNRPQIIMQADSQNKSLIAYATVGRSALLEQLEKAGRINLADIRDKREVYGIFYLENVSDDIDEMLLVAGSDKRGTIYGIFTLSEKMGVSPLVYWGDVTVSNRDSIVFDSSMEEISKEPSVKYRGFFINDEWPCFGNWTMEHFGGFTAEMYDKVFELLLRLKGNYLWPAMWTSSFALDGPGQENEVLADIYGVIMGNSHHEPCLRASEEWDIYKVQDLGYGREWDYFENKEGLLKYWRDGLKRSGVFENIVTIGMRGERDSEMQGNHTLGELIEMLKEIITNQEKLICEYADREDYKHPRLLAIYKEVETYFYGDATTPGLKDWDGLENTILMFCEDNYGNMRWLPNEKIRGHKGGFGMYFHLDYHGSPISYEWINSTPLTKIWEQMTQAYEYGVQDLWVVNVGDLKGNEFPLSYFMNLAYDYDKWGVSNLNSADEFTSKWTKLQFFAQAEEVVLQKLADLLTEALLVLYKRRPEALNSKIYHPAHFHEADRMIQRAKDICERVDSIKAELNSDALSAYYSMIERPLKAGMNLLLMQLYAGKNEWYANQGKVIANVYGELLAQAIRLEKQYNDEYKRFNNGKWSGMELGSHIGFTKWNEDGCKMPVRCMVESLDMPRMLVSRADEERVYVKNYGTPETITIKDFMDADAKPVVLEIANGGNRKFECEIQGDACTWLNLEWTKKEIHVMETLKISCNLDKLPDEPQMVSIYISDSDAVVKADIWAVKQKRDSYPKGTYFESAGAISMLASNAAYQTSVEDATWIALKNCGVTESSCKVFPIGKTFEIGKGPVLGFYFVAGEEGEYTLEVITAPSNAADQGGRMYYGIRLNDGMPIKVASISEDFKAGNPACEEWCEGVLMQAHKNQMKLHLHQGLNKLEVQAVDPGVVLEKLILHRGVLKDSYLGPVESFQI